MKVLPKIIPLWNFGPAQLRTAFVGHYALPYTEMEPHPPCSWVVRLVMKMISKRSSSTFPPLPVDESDWSGSILREYLPTPYGFAGRKVVFNDLEAERMALFCLP
jgi:hypothetical protein